MSNLVECPKCNELFTRRDNMLRHQERDKKKCDEAEKRLQHRLELARDEVRKDYERRLTNIEEKNKTVIDSLIHTPSGVKTRQRIVANTIAQEKICNFERVVKCTIIPEKTLRETVELMADGDVILFRRIFIDNVKPEERCIRVKDFAREKYEYFDGKMWVLTTLTWIVEHFASRLHSKYKFLVFEKCKKVDEIDRMYCEEDQLEENMEQVNDLCWEYANITEHVTKLGILEPDFINEIKRGIRALLLDPNSKGPEIGAKEEEGKEAPPVVFEYNATVEDTEDEESLDVSDTDDTDTDNENDTQKPEYTSKEKKYDDIILPSLFKVLGIKFNVLK